MCFRDWCGSFTRTGKECNDEHDDDDAFSTSKLKHSRKLDMERSLRRKMAKANEAERHQLIRQVEEMSERLLMANRKRLDEIRARAKRESADAARLQAAVERVEQLQSQVDTMKAFVAKEERRRKKRIAKKKAREATPELEEPPSAPPSSDREKTPDIKSAETSTGDE